jgi:hypothetical protein
MRSSRGKQALVADIQAWVRREATEAVSNQAQDMLDSEIDSANQAAQQGATQEGGSSPPRKEDRRHKNYDIEFVDGRELFFV